MIPKDASAYDAGKEAGTEPLEADASALLRATQDRLECIAASLSVSLEAGMVPAEGSQGTEVDTQDTQVCTAPEAEAGVHGGQTSCPPPTSPATLHPMDESLDP